MALVNTDLLMSMINDILDYCQLKDDKLRLCFQEFSLQDLLNQVYNLMKIQTQLKGIQLLVKNKVGSMIIQSDLRRIKQILINLLSNAIKFTEYGYIKLIVAVSTFENRIKFTVEDTGSGIEEEVLTNLGQPFATFSTNTNSNQGGIGLGLNLCKQLIGLLGPNNYFTVKTKQGQGSKFSFVIYSNLQFPNQNASIKEEESSFGDLSTINQNSENITSENCSMIEKEVYYQEFITMQKLSDNYQKQGVQELEEQDILLQFNGNINVLIADDNVFNLFVLKNQLEKINEKFKILKSSNGKLAYDTFCLLNKTQNLKTIQLIIMDCEMPIMDGFEASKKITAKIKTENYCRCIIIGYTAFIGLNEEQKSVQSGMSDILQKPATNNDLKTKIVFNLQKLFN